MEIAEKVMRAQTDDALRELFIKENMAFIYSCTAQAVGHFVDESDDIFSVALTAFNDAVSSYEERKGYFQSFAKTCIHNRIKDYYRIKSRHNRVVPFSSLQPKTITAKKQSLSRKIKTRECPKPRLKFFL